jgi:hypothetical protein
VPDSLIPGSSRPLDRHQAPSVYEAIAGKTDIRERIAILGLGYVGLPVAVGFAMKFPGTIGFDIARHKVDACTAGRDPSRELEDSQLAAAVHAEYGMTEMLSQAYALGDGLFKCPPWLRVLVRPQDDPFQMQTSGAGLLCVADLANVHSCAFIETADLGRVFEDGSFEVLGRVDNSDVRGCSLLAL